MRAEYPRAVGTVIRMVFRPIVQMARERTDEQIASVASTRFFSYATNTRNYE